MMPFLSVILLFNSQKQYKIWIAVPISFLTDILYLGISGYLNYTETARIRYGISIFKEIFLSIISDIIIHIICITAVILIINIGILIRKKFKKNNKTINSSMIKKRIVIISIVLIFLMGFLPDIWSAADGGTVSFEAFFYQIIIWNSFDAVYNDDMTEIIEITYYTGTDLYIFPFNFGYKGRDDFGRIRISD